MVDDLRNYLSMAAGITEATTTKAKDVVTALLSQGMALSSKAVPAPEVMGQVQELADNLVTTSKENHDALLSMIRSEVDKAVGRMGFIREDELAALRRHVERLEKQLADVRTAAAGGADPEPVVEAVPVVDAQPVAATDATDEPPVKKKRKKIVVEPGT